MSTPQTAVKAIPWSLYYIDSRSGQLNCMDVYLPCTMGKDSIRDYIKSMGHEIDKAISELHCYTY